MLTKTILPNGDVIFQEVADNLQPKYKIWSGNLLQSLTDNLYLYPINQDDSDFLPFGNAVENNALVTSIERKKEGSYSILLPYERKDIFVYCSNNSIDIFLADMGDGTTTFEIQSKDSNGVNSDSIINYENFEIKVRQYYEVVENKIGAPIPPKKP